MDRQRLNATPDATRNLHAIGQRLWLDNISRGMLVDGTLRHYIESLSVTGLTSNPAIFDHAIRKSGLYDAEIAAKAHTSPSSEALFYELALQDLTAAADLFRPAYDSTEGLDGWVSLEVSPLLADDTTRSVQSAVTLHELARRPNLFIKLPGTVAGMAAIEECIFRGIPVNVTLLFSLEQHLAAADAYLRGIERRIVGGKDPRIASVASIFVSRWDVAANPSLPTTLHNHLGIAVAQQIYGCHRELLASARWLKLQAAGARPQRLVWASTGTKDAAASDTLYVQALAAPDTINTMPEPTLLAFAAHGKILNLMPTDDRAARDVLAAITAEGVDLVEMAARLQREGAAAFSRSWHDMLACIATRSGNLQRVDSFSTG